VCGCRRAGLRIKRLLRFRRDKWLNKIRLTSNVLSSPKCAEMAWRAFKPAANFRRGKSLKRRAAIFGLFWDQKMPLGIPRSGFGPDLSELNAGMKEIPRLVSAYAS
jgi:hypothetical protein